MNSLADMLTTAGQSAARAPTTASHRRKLTKAEADDVRGILDGRYYTTPDRPVGAPIKRRVTWRHAEAGLPDSDLEVLVALDDGDVRPAFHDGEQWRDLTAMPLPDGIVLMWCEYPDHPMPPKGHPE